MMTQQEIFDKVWAHFNQKGARLSMASGEQEGECRYRLSRKPDGKARCAVGVLIPDELYEPEMDDNENGLDLDSVLHTIGLHEHRKFLGELQMEHDNATTVAGLREELRHFATARNLTVPA